MTAPTGKPYWENPCGNRGTTHGLDIDLSEQRTTAEMLRPLLLRSQIALTKALVFSKEWVEKLFHTKLHDHHNEWKTGGYQWLPSKEELPKNFGQNLTEEELEERIEKSLEETLKSVHKNMQIYGVGLEQVHHDQVLYQDEWASKFNDMQTENKQVMCELESVLMELNGDIQLEMVPREVMSREYRHFPQTGSRNLRDWFILRDFITNLEYLEQVCDYVIKVETSIQQQ